MKEISIPIGEKTIVIPNCWDRLTPDAYIFLCKLLALWASAQISAFEVKFRYVCFFTGTDPEAAIRGEADQYLYLVSRMVTFMFLIEYPKGSLEPFDPELRTKLRKMPPEYLPDKSMVRYFEDIKYKYRIDACYAAQLVPDITIGETTYTGYDVYTAYDRITCSLSASQFVDAYQLLADINGKEALLASILYSPLPYRSDAAHKQASTFEAADPVTLQAVALNFQALVSYLFTCTPYSVLQTRSTETAAICTGMAEGIYNLSADGLGDVTTIEQMNILTYFTILRKNLIESVIAMHDAKMDITEIASKTGLPIPTIRKML